MGKFLLPVFILFCFPLFAQEDPNQLGIFEENSVVYRSQRNGGVIVYTNGLGGNFYWGKHLDGFKRRMLGIEITTIKHPKEVRQYNPIHQDAKSYAFGKINSVVALRPTIGLKVDKFDKLRENGVQVGYFIAAGPAIAFLKPVYLEIGIPEDDSSNPFQYERIETERYDPDKHTYSNIYGRSPYIKGIEETTLTVGLHFKVGAHFEYSPYKEGIKALEVGFAGDIYPTKLPIMASDVNQSVILNVYLNLLFGKKYKE
ncbi:MAG: hypothetical protein ACPF8V_01470 [Luteibaculum sp.]